MAEVNPLAQQAPGAAPPSAPAVAPAPASQPAAQEPAAAPAPTLISGAVTPAAAPAAPAPAPVADDWRAKLSGGDAKELERLKRFTDEAAVWKSYRALEQKMSSGELKAALAPDATPEQIKEWRAANGVPEDPNDYLKGLPSGYVVGDDDRVLLGDFAKYMHDTNAPTPVVQKAAEWYFKFAEKQAAEDAQKAAVFRRGAEDTLRAEWQKDYHENLNRGGEVLTHYFPEDIRETITNARLPDGTMLGDHPSFAKALATISREMNPAYTMAPGISGSTGGTLGDEIARIEKLMKDNSPDYWRGETGAKTQERYRQLVDARSRQQARSGVAA